MPAEAKRAPQSCKEYAMSFVDFEDAMTAGFTNHPLTHYLVCLMGSSVRIRTSDKLLYDGVLAGFTGNYDLGLRMVHPVVDESDGDMVPTREECFERKVIPFSSVVSVQAVVDMETVTKNAFCSDSELSRLNGSTSEKRLEKWESDVVEEELVLDDSGSTVGWSAEEMFKKNELHFGVTTDYDENLQQYNSVEVDKSGVEYKVKYAEAERLAKIIEANPASKRANDLENDDEERDIVQRPTGTTNSTAPALSSNVASQGSMMYFRSNRSRGGMMSGSDRGGRGGSGSRGGISYNQREIRSGSRSGAQQRDYESGHHGSYQGRIGSTSRYHPQSMTPMSNSSQSAQQVSSRSVSTPGAAPVAAGSERNLENAHSATTEDKRRNAYSQSKQNVMGPRAPTPVEGQQAQRRNQSHQPRGGYKDSTTELRKFSQEYRLADNKVPTTHGSSSSSSPTPRPSVMTQHRGGPPRSAGRGSGDATGNVGAQRQQSTGKDDSPPHSGRGQVKQAEYRRTMKNVPPSQGTDNRSLGDSAKNVSSEALPVGSASPPEQPTTVERQTSSASSIKSVPLNPDAEEFRPMHMQNIVTQQPPALLQQQMLRSMTPANGSAFFPLAVPPNVPAAPQSGGSVLLNQSGVPQAMYPTPGSFSVQVYPSNPPFYNVQSSQAPVAILHSSGNLRPSRKSNGGGQHALPVGAAPGNSAAAQPLMTTQTPVGFTQSPYLVQYTGPLPAGAQSSMGSNPLFLGQTRVLHPQYILPEPGANCGTMPQSVYALPQFLHVGPYGTPNPGMQQVIPGMQNPSHPPPGYAVAGGVEPSNQNPANAGNSVVATGAATNSNAQTTAFAQAPATAAPGAYPLAAAVPNQQLLLLPGNAYVAAAPTPIYANSNVVCTSATAPPGTPTQQPSGNGLIQLTGQAAAAMYAAAGQAPFTPDTGYMQYAATGAQLSQGTYHQNLLRSSSVPAYGQAHPGQQPTAGNAGVNNGST